jgi:hypothetical protein
VEFGMGRELFQVKILTKLVNFCNGVKERIERNRNEK